MKLDWSSARLDLTHDCHLLRYSNGSTDLKQQIIFLSQSRVLGHHHCILGPSTNLPLTLCNSHQPERLAQINPEVDNLYSNPSRIILAIISAIHHNITAIYKHTVFAKPTTPPITRSFESPTDHKDRKKWQPQPDHGQSASAARRSTLPTTHRLRPPNHVQCPSCARATSWKSTPPACAITSPLWGMAGPRLPKGPG